MSPKATLHFSPIIAVAARLSAARVELIVANVSENDPMNHSQQMRPLRFLDCS